jgi:hypothetical protein
MLRSAAACGGIQKLGQNQALLSGSLAGIKLLNIRSTKFSTIQHMVIHDFGASAIITL